ncbi:MULTISPECIES: histidine ammonia-lyase [Flammeovirga]|uniref:Histidine ammonia-lyase n=1 Tax=Flammeovirga agarivorans TaxID=2726742 RepID=A0A7X8SM32_9BACT|nr:MULTISPECIES: histidine ammonia-lyase [Flammeovirga]NLR92739.1 histidine ammonia-lyase [Flammeovirga agarivorans]
MKKVFNYGIDRLTVNIALDIARGNTKGVLNGKAKEKVLKSQSYVQEIVAKGDVVYGVNTGFGPLCTTIISEEDTSTLQHKILQSHSVGVGNIIPKETSKLMLITKAHALAQGFSGIALTTLERIIWHIDKDIVPTVPEKGSVGASGDLAPLSHLFLPLIGLGEVYTEDGSRAITSDVLSRLGMKSLQLGPKEGLALINGTQFILSHAVKVVERLAQALDTADVIGAMSLEGLMGSARPFEPELHQIRAYKGTQLVATRLREMLNGSEILESHVDCDRVQDPYSLRCMPQVHGASRNAWLHLKELVEVELNSVTDNPIILDAENAISGGNFHGQPLALPLDYAGVAAAEIGNIADRRCYMMIEGRFGLPKLLMKDVGLNSGFMIPQYTSAALVTENKTLCFPASADSVPTSLGQEDHVSMGSISGRKTLQIIDNLEQILAVELLYAAQALDFRRPLKSSPIIEGTHAYVRERVAHADEDRVLAYDIKAMHDIVKSGALVHLANEISKKEKIDLNGEYKQEFSF